MGRRFARYSIVVLVPYVLGCGGEEPTPPAPIQPAKKAPAPPPPPPPAPATTGNYIVIDDVPAEAPVEAPVPVDLFRVQEARTRGRFKRQTRLGPGIQFACTFEVSELPRRVEFACEIQGPAGAVRELARSTGERKSSWMVYEADHFAPRLDPRNQYAFRIVASLDPNSATWTPITPWGPVTMEVAD